MFIKSTRNFRTSIKLEKPDTKHNKYIDEHFIGTYNSENIKGFFGLYHGIKTHPDKYLRSTAVNVAADEQAIYEFMQNAVDCHSTDFFVFYDDSYFLAINNGAPFSVNDVKAILNLGQSDKGSAEIGSYGVGFKLAHRLIGKGDGIEELINEYKGPIIFSWSRFRELEEFLEGKVKIGYYSKENTEYYDRAAWLFKICLTNFPTNPGEVVKDLNYEDRILFTEKELSETIGFVVENFEKHSENIDTRNLKQGSLFFMRLGEGKKKYIDNNYSEIERGIEYSLNTLSNLKRIFINDQFIEKKKLTTFEYSIGKDTSEFLEISPRNRDRDIKVTFGYDFRYWEDNHFLNAPNFYDYFPMESERHNFRFMLHCNAFDKMVNRRELQNGEINSKILASILPRLKADIDRLKEDDDKGKFLSLYAALLFSEHTKNKWIEDEFFKPLAEFTQTCIPTSDGFSQNSENVKVKNSTININPSDIGCPEIEWFYWNEHNNKALADEALRKDKLGLKKWNIIDLLNYAIDHNKVDDVNDWIKSINEANISDPDRKDKTYLKLLYEVDLNLTETYFKKISQLKLFKFSDGEYYSFKEVFEREDLLLITEKTSNIKFEIRHLGITTTLMDISKNPNLNRILAQKINDATVFNLISLKCKENQLKPESKQNLFLALLSFEGVNKNQIGDLELFWDTQRRIKPLNRLIKADLEVPHWLFQFKINKFDYFPELDDYLINTKDIYSSLIQPEWDTIIDENQFTAWSIESFYKSVTEYFNIEKPSLLLDDKKCIYAEGEFHHHDEVFFNHNLTSITDYASLSSALLKMTKCLIPYQTIIELLGQKPFNIYNDEIKPIVQECCLNVPEATSLIDYSYLEGVDMFSSGYFENSNESTLTFFKNEAVRQFYSDSKPTIDFIENHLSPSFCLLPKSLSKYKTKVLRNIDLQEAIIEELGSDLSQHAEDLINILSGSCLRKLYEDCDEFIIEFRDHYSQSDFEYKLLDALPEDLIDSFNDKISILHNNRVFHAKEITNRDSFKIEKFKLSLSKILINNQLIENGKIITDLISNLNKGGINKTRLDRIFDLTKEIDKEWLSDILENLLSSQNNFLDNSEQLAFVILYHKFIASLNLSEINIQRADGQNDHLNYTWYTNNISFIGTAAILDERYFEINKIIGIDSTTRIFIVDDVSRLVFEPYIDIEKEVFVCEYIGNNLTENERNDLLDFLFDFWSKSSANKRLIQNLDWSKFNDQDAETIIGINPYEIIWDTNLALESEKCPPWLANWADIVEKQSFLKDFGLNMNDCPISLIRRSFLTTEPCSPKYITSVKQQARKLLGTTFEWLTENEICLETETQYELLLALSEESDMELEERDDFELLSKCKEWEADYYKVWKEETDCKISIYLYLGEIPRLVTYDDHILKRISRGSFTYNSDENILFINGTNLILENVLYQVIEDDTIPFEQDHFTQLLLLKNRTTTLITTDEFERVKKENLILKSRLEDLESKLLVNEEGYSKKGGLPADVMKARNIEACHLVKEKLLMHKEFDVSEWDPDEDFYVIRSKVKKYGQYIDIVVVSAKSYPIHLSPFAFNVLASNPNNQLFVRDRSDVHNVTFNDIFHDNQYVNMVFDTNYVPNNVLAYLAKVFNYVTNTKFIIENPHFSAVSILEGFGLDNVNAGSAYIPENENEW